jgi:acetyl/propionyl-CoA carboxylase alpha subunit
LLAKLSVWGETRELAIQRMRRAVNEYRIIGMTTNLGLFEELMADDYFRAGDLHTTFLDEFMNRSRAGQADQDQLLASILAAAYTETEKPQVVPEMPSTPHAWRIEARRGLLR